MTEGNGHVIDPDGDARRALQEAVAEHGPEVLSNAAVIDNVCRDHLAGLPGESILIGDAARTNVPALLSELIPQLGNYGAIQSAAATLAGEHNLDMAASLWVVREFARALGYIAPATGTSAAFPGSGPRPVASSGPRPVSGSGLAAGAGPAEMGGATGAAEDSGMTGAGGEESRSAGPGGGETGGAVAGGAVAGGAVAGGAVAGAAAAAGMAADEAGHGEGAGSEGAGSERAGSAAFTSGPGASGPGASGAIDSGAGGPSGASASGTGAGGVSGAGASERGSGEAGTGGETIPRGVAASRSATGGSRGGQVAGDGSAASGSEPGYGAGSARGGTGQGSGGPGNTGSALGSSGAAGQASGALGTAGPAGGGSGATGPVGGGPGATGPVGGSGPVSTGPMSGIPGAGGPGMGGPGAGGAWGGPSAPVGPAGSGTGGGEGWRGSASGAAPEDEPGFPLPLPAGRLPGRQPQRPKLLNRNTVGIAAAIALIAGYLGVAAVAHLSPFPAKTVAPPSASQSSSPPASTSSNPGSSPAVSADPSPPSQLDILLTKIPAAVRSRGSCLNAGTGSGATAVIQCQKLQGLGANTIIYYLYPNRTALANGFSAFLKTAKFSKRRECTTNGNFSDFIVECESTFAIKTPGMTGSIAEYVNQNVQNPVITTTDNQQNVMAVMVGTNDGDLLAYWNQMEWVVTP